MTKFRKIIRKKTEKQLIKEFISLFKICIAKKERLNQRFGFVLPGGSSPVNLYKALSKTKINWKNIDLFWVDERFVSQGSNNSNFRLVKKHLINKINISRKNIFPVNTQKNTVNESAIDYEKSIKKYFRSKKVSFDLILLGMGSDGHIASIFRDNIDLKSNRMISVILGKDYKRITLSLNFINKAKKIFLWLNNKKKSNIYKKIRNKIKVPVNYLKKSKTILFLIK